MACGLIGGWTRAVGEGEGLVNRRMQQVVSARRGHAGGYRLQQQKTPRNAFFYAGRVFTLLLRRYDILMCSLFFLFLFCHTFS